MAKKKAKKNKGLGQGLAALLRDVDHPEISTKSSKLSAGYQEIPLDILKPSPYQPRKVFNDVELSGLATSIKKNGIIQPLVARMHSPGQYELVAGERRLRAARLADLKTVPVVVQNFSDQEAMAIALVENLQREDLSPLEEAEALLKMSQEMDMSQEEIAQVLGKSRSHVANVLRLNKLPEEIKEMLRKNQITPGMARSLIGHPDAVRLARLSIESNLNVRQLEDLVRDHKKGEKENSPRRPNVPKGEKKSGDLEPLDLNERDKKHMEEILTKELNMPVKISIGKSKHHMVIEFTHMESLDLLLNRLQGLGY